MNNIQMNQTVDSKDITHFNSVGKKVGNIKDMFPAFSGIRIMMMPFYVQDIDGSLPDALNHYKPLLKKMMERNPEHVTYYEGNTGYLTIDEMHLKPNQIQRKPGLHVDGMYQGKLAGAWGGHGGGWGSCGNGMLLCSNTDDLCKMWNGEFQGVPINDGDCEHLMDQLSTKDEYSFKAGDVIWADGLLVHQSFETKTEVDRQFIRISMPNNSPWFSGYTENPLDIKACGEIISTARI